MTTRFAQRLSIATLSIAALLPLQGCMSGWAAMQGGGPSRSTPSLWERMTAEKVEVEDRATAQTGIVNHTGNYINGASVNGAGGGGMSAWGAGGANICCTSIPRVWYPGMKVLVRWSVPVGRTDVWREKIVEVEKYDKPGSIYMHFFPNDEVRVVVSNAAGYSKKHPIPPTPEPANATTPQEQAQ